MPTLNIGGKKVTVGDDFLKLSPEQQNSTVEEIASSFAPAQEREPAAGTVPVGQSRSDDYDVPLSAGVGLAKAGIGMAGMSGDLRELAASGAGALTGASPETISRYLRHVPLMGGPTSGQIRSTIEGVTGDLYTPRTKWGERAETIGEFAPGVLGGGGIAARTGRILIPAAGSQAAGELTEGTAAEPYARAAGGLVGGMAASKAENIAQRMGSRLPSLERGAANSLPDAAGDQYEAITQAATKIRTTLGQRSMIADSIENHLHPQNFRRGTAPKTYEILDEHVRQGSKTPDVADLMTARQQLGNVSGKDGIAAGQARDIIDQVLEAYMPGVGKQLATADQNWNAYKTAQMLGERFNKAELQAAGAYSGLNLGNRLRQQATNVVSSPRLSRYMKAEDKAALEALDRGTPLQNATRWAGNYLGGGGGLGALGASALLGHLGGGPLGAAAAVGGGLALKRGYNRSIAREAQRIADTIVARSPEAQRLGVNYFPPMTIGQSVPGGVRGGLLSFLGQP